MIKIYSQLRLLFLLFFFFFFLFCLDLLTEGNREQLRGAMIRLCRWSPNLLPRFLTRSRAVSSAASAPFTQDVLDQISNRLRQLPRITLSENDTFRYRASVLMPLCNINGSAAVLFTKRTDHVGTHKGDVWCAFVFFLTFRLFYYDP